jgi:thymidylate kinase
VNEPDDTPPWRSGAASPVRLRSIEAPPVMAPPPEPAVQEASESPDPPGRPFTVAILGPDGAGKSAVTAQLPAALPFPSRRVYMGVNLEASNLVLPSTRLLLHIKRRLGERPDLAPSSPEAATGPGTGGRRRLPAMVRRVGHTLTLLGEEWFRQAMIWRYLRRGEVVLLDRHFLFDYYFADVAPGVPRPLTRRFHGFLLRRVYPRPDLVVVLDAPAEVLYSRKGEGTLESLRRRRDDYLGLRGLVDCSAVVDATRPLEVVVAETAAVVHSHALGGRAAGARTPPPG